MRWEQEKPSRQSDLPTRLVPQERRKEEEWPKDQFERDAIIQRLSEIGEGELEQLMVYYFRRRGYTVEPTPTSGDRGADLLITVSDRHIAVRLKRQDTPVGNKAVQEALSGRVF